MFPDALLRLIPGDRGGHAALLAEERFWDAHVTGQPSPPDAIDPVVKTIIQQVHALDDAPLPDAGFAARLEDRLLRSGPGALALSSAREIGGIALPESPATSSGWSTLTRRRAMNLAATAALLAIMLASVLVTLRAGTREVRDEDAFPLVLGPGITGEALLLQARFENFPAGVLYADVSRWVLQPGAEAQVGGGGYSGEGPSAILVEAGTLTIQSDGPIAVTRSGASTPVTVEAASRIELQTGDRGFAPSGVVSLWQNADVDVVRILEASIRTTLVGFAPKGALNYTVVSEEAIPRPDRPLVMNVFQITMQPEAALPSDTISGLEMLKVESGRLVAIDIDEEGNAFPPVSLGQGTRLLGSFPPGRVFRSANDQPVTVMLVTIANTNPLRPGG